MVYLINLKKFFENVFLHEGMAETTGVYTAWRKKLKKILEIGKK